MNYRKHFSLLCCLLLFSAVYGQKKNMRIIDFLNVPSVSRPSISPDGQQVVYVLSESDWNANRQISHIWRVNMDGTNAIQFTNGEKGENNPAWSPDGHWISFLADREGGQGSQLHLIYNGGGEAKALTDHETSISGYQWSKDGAHIYFLASDPKSKEEKKEQEDKDDVIAFDEDYKQRHLWKVEVATGKEERITEGDYSILGFDLSEDGKEILVARGPSPLYDQAPMREIWLMDVDGANMRALTDNEVNEGGFELSPDGETALFIAFANEAFEFYYNDKLFITTTGQNPQNSVPLKDFEYEVLSATWSPDGEDVYFTANMGLETQLWRMNVKSKKAKQLSRGDHSFTGWAYHKEKDLMVFGINKAGSPGDLYLFEDGNFRQITHHFDYLSESFHLPAQEKISWKGEDGVMVEGLLHYPIGYEAGKSYPLVVQTHGGPAASDKFGFSRRITHYHPVLTAQGYAVLQPNYRGSTGYGDEFLRDMVGSYFNQAHKDVMAGVDALIEKGIADPDRLAKMGWSAGGHMTNKIITYTDRFKAASSGAGAMNWISMYAQSDVRIYRTPWFGGTPWQKDAPIDAYWDNSPLKDVHKVSTPTLIFVGEKDPRVPSPQSVELFRALKSLDVPTHLYIAPREPHGWRELRHRLQKINTELAWYAKYVLGKDYSKELPPSNKGGEEMD